MSYRTRVAKLQKEFDSGDELREHWLRVWTERLNALQRFWKMVPRSHRKRVEEVIGDMQPLLLVDGPAWAGEGAPLMRRWAMVRIAWGDNHPYNRTQPDPIPPSLIELLLNNPDAEHWTCPGCGIPLPYVNAKIRPYTRAGYLTALCPVCNAILPQSSNGTSVC